MSPLAAVDTAAQRLESKYDAWVHVVILVLQMRLVIIVETTEVRFRIGISWWTHLSQSQIVLLEFGRSPLDCDCGPVYHAVVIHHRFALESQVGITRFRAR